MPFMFYSSQIQFEDKKNVCVFLWVFHLLKFIDVVLPLIMNFSSFHASAHSCALLSLWSGKSVVPAGGAHIMPIFLGWRKVKFVDCVVKDGAILNLSQRRLWIGREVISSSLKVKVFWICKSRHSKAEVVHLHEYACCGWSSHLKCGSPKTLS